jgi:Mlc titration factor MtfA (ptsG expression regulator)
LEHAVFASNLTSLASSVLRGAGERARSWLPMRQAPTAFPQEWRQWLHEHVGPVAHLPGPLRLRHEDLVREFVARKPFLGCAGLEVTDHMRVVVAGFACLLILARGMGAYSQVREILVYPGEFLARRAGSDASGVVHEHVQALRGESSPRGQVVLSWADVLTPAHPGHNLVVHEFAHQLDQAKGTANGAPFTTASEARRLQWAALMTREFEQHRQNALAGEATLLSHYGATSPAEFFAVCSEVFFELPQAMRYVHPSLYRELGQYYRLDPAEWFGGMAQGDAGALR